MGIRSVRGSLHTRSPDHQSTEIQTPGQFRLALEWRDGLVPGLRFGYAGPEARGVQSFFFLYFVMTGLHAVHLAAGIGVVSWMSMRRVRAAAVETAGLYWHFVDAVWIFLYPVIYLVELWR